MPTIDDVNAYIDDLERRGQGTPEERAAYADKLMKDYGLSGGGITDKALEVAAPVIGAAGKAADYLGGLTRVTAANIADVATPKGVDLGKASDFVRAVKGEAPTGSELLERAGVGENGRLSDVAPGLFNQTGEGLKLQRGGPLDVTGRGAAGVALETALDPLTYLSIGGLPALKQAGKQLLKGEVKAAAKAVAPRRFVPQALKETGEDIYKMPFSKIDAPMRKEGRKTLSDEYLRRRLVGGKETLLDKEGEILSDLGKQRKAVFDSADTAGAAAPVAEGYGRLASEVESTIKELARREKDTSALQKLADYYRAQQYDLTPRAATPAGKTKKIADVPDVKRVSADIFYPGKSGYEDVLQPQRTGRPYTTDAEVSMGTNPQDLSIKRSADIEYHDPSQKWMAQQSGALPSYTVLPTTKKVVIGNQRGNPFKARPEVKPVTTNQANFMKETDYKNSSAWKNLKKTKAGEAAEIAEALMLKDATEKGVGGALGELAKRDVIDLNARMGGVLSGRDRLGLEAVSESAKPYVSRVDALAAGAGQLGAVGAKKALDLGFSTPVATRAGVATIKAGEALENIPFFKKLSPQQQAIWLLMAREAAPQLDRAIENRYQENK